jgi:hypothetical protein
MAEHPHFEHPPFDDKAIVNAETHHETSDVNVKALLISVAVFVVFGFVTHFVLFGLFNFYRGMFRGDVNARLTEVSVPVNAAIPPEPRLQPFQGKDAQGAEASPILSTPVADLRQMRHAEDEALHNPAWIDKTTGKVRLPIDVAKQLAVQRLATSGQAGTPVPPLSGGAH